MHFSVMVVGEDVEGQLAPFQETNMGPIAPEYMEKVDRTDEVEDLFPVLLADGVTEDGAQQSNVLAHRLGHFAADLGSAHGADRRQ